MIDCNNPNDHTFMWIWIISCIILVPLFIIWRKKVDGNKFYD
jgi:hypothetical protein